MRNVAVVITIPASIWQALDRDEPGQWRQQLRQRVEQLLPAGVRVAVTFAKRIESPGQQPASGTLTSSVWQRQPSLSRVLWLSMLAACMLAALLLWRRRGPLSRPAALGKRRQQDQRPAEGRQPTPKGPAQSVLVQSGPPTVPHQRRPHPARSALRQFDELLRADRATLTAALQAVELADWSIALRGASEELRRRVLELLAPRSAQRLRAELDQPKPVRLDEVESAQSRIIDVARRLCDGAAALESVRTDYS